MADRIGVINKGELILVEEKAALMKKLGKKQLTLELQRHARAALPDALGGSGLELADGGARAGLHLRRRRRARADRRAAARASTRSASTFKDLHTRQSLARGHLRRPGARRRRASVNLHAIRAIYRFEMARTFRTLVQSIVAPVISTSLYFVVFGSAIGSRMTEIDGVSYGAFIVPGLIMLSILTESISNASFGIYMPKWSGTIYELLSAPVSALEIVIGYVGAAATKSVHARARSSSRRRACSCRSTIEHPLVMVLVPGADVGDVQPVRLHHRHLGRQLREAADRAAAGRDAARPSSAAASTRSTCCPPVWQTVTLFNPVVYLISGFRWSFYGESDVGVGDEPRR